MNTPAGNVLPKFNAAPPPRRTIEIEFPKTGDVLDDRAEETLPKAPSSAASAAPTEPTERSRMDDAAGLTGELWGEAAGTDPEPPAQPSAAASRPAEREDGPTATPLSALAEAAEPMAERQSPSSLEAPAEAMPEATTEATTSGRQSFSDDETIKLLMDLASLQEDLERAREQTNSARRHVEIVQEQLAKTTVEKTTLQEQLQRLMAEFDNYRKRVEREKLEAIERGKQAVILNMLEALDNFDRALATGRAEGGNLADFLAGVELIQRQLADGLSSIGVKPIPAVGEAFDPMFHEAIATDETDEYKPNTVIAELKRGYMLGDRLLRPSMVRVAVRPTSS